MVNESLDSAQGEATSSEPTEAPNTAPVLRESLQDPKAAAERLQDLVTLSARLGRDLDLVQAGGGNTSIKENGTLWVKASGKWLAHAANDDMFLPVPMADIARQLAAQDEKFPQYQTRTGEALRPSVETAVHAVMPQRVVIHVHSVRTIAWAARVHGAAGVTPLLENVRWSWIPYTHPGIPLALRIQQEMDKRPDVLILENHGLVVAAEDCAAAEQLLQAIEGRLDGPVRHAAAGELGRLQALTGAEWEVSEDSEAHALGMSAKSWEIAKGGTLFPDQCVYLGPAAAILEPGDTAEAAAQRYRETYDFEPVFLIVAGAGVLTKRDMKRAARELLLCVKRVIERIPSEAQPVYLPPNQVARLMNWDAEKYRIAMARQTK
jgi:rhamnose utilization protein RhaD (predicted bifunctional aldolase and dehydrogenase)